MNKDEAVKTLIDMANTLYLNPDTSQGVALKMAIKALEQEPCEDAISRQAVLALPRNKIRNFKGEVVNETINVTDIETLPSVNPQEQKPCEDCISRQAAIDAVNIGNLHPGIVEALQSILADLPPVTAQPKTGHWIEENINEWSRKVFCSECGCPPSFEYVSNGDVYSASGYGVINKTRFCPNCGAKMIEPKESEVSDADSN